MKLMYVLLTANIINPLIACENSDYNPDGEYFFYEECLHKNRSKFKQE